MAIGFWQVLLILLIVLILFGRGKLPALAEDLGKSVRLFKKGLNEEETAAKNSKSEDENKPNESGE